MMGPPIVLKPRETEQEVCPGTGCLSRNNTWGDQKQVVGQFSTQAAGS